SKLREPVARLRVEGRLGQPALAQQQDSLGAHGQLTVHPQIAQHVRQLLAAKAIAQRLQVASGYSNEKTTTTTISAIASTRVVQSGRPGIASSPIEATLNTMSPRMSFSNWWAYAPLPSKKSARRWAARLAARTAEAGAKRPSHATRVALGIALGVALGVALGAAARTREERDGSSTTG